VAPEPAADRDAIAAHHIALVPESGHIRPEKRAVGGAGTDPAPG
jgi:hypothetical protein